MKRRDFITSLSLFAGGITLGCSTSACKNNGSKSVKFGISTDIHNDIIHDGELRLQKYLAEIESKNVDFIIDLGDFCFPTEANKRFIDIWKSSPVPKYNVLGNHDMDLGDKDDFMEYVGMEKRYYSFDIGDYHFIVLDPNNLNIDGEFIPYANANFYIPGDQRTYVDPEQLIWLRNDLQQTQKVCVIFAHQNIGNERNESLKQVKQILENANIEAGFRKVAVAFNGHGHSDYAKFINGIHYVHINSMSYLWVGDNYMYPERFSDEINQKRPSLKKTIPYQDPLFAVVTIHNNEINIEGKTSSYIQPGPIELGMKLQGHTKSSVPKISDRILEF